MYDNYDKKILEVEQNDFSLGDDEGEDSSSSDDVPVHIIENKKNSLKLQRQMASRRDAFLMTGPGKENNKRGLAMAVKKLLTLKEITETTPRNLPFITPKFSIENVKTPENKSSLGFIPSCGLGFQNMVSFMNGEVLSPDGSTIQNKRNSLKAETKKTVKEFFENIGEDEKEALAKRNN